MNNYKLSQETLEKALENQLASGTIPPDWTTEDILDSAFCAAEGIPFMVTKLITRWASAV
tara:strand:+ start:4597 stop:4776 length:180 start_codon:yes stop_codon:yes gene_type:complete